MTRSILAFSSFVSVVFTASIVHAQAAKPAPPTPTAPAQSKPAVMPQPPAAPAPMVPATPAPEIAALGKASAGTWKCKGSMMMPTGQSMPLVSKMSTKLDLNGFWLKTSYAEAGKSGFKFDSMTTFNTATKTWHRMMASNMGSFETTSSEGPKDGKAVWTGTSNSAMGEAMARHYEETVGKEFKMWGEYSQDKGKTWMKAYEASCTK
jgi:hypothetical protein